MRGVSPAQPSPANAAAEAGTASGLDPAGSARALSLLAAQRGLGALDGPAAAQQSVIRLHPDCPDMPCRRARGRDVLGRARGAFRVWEAWDFRIGKGVGAEDRAS